MWHIQLLTFGQGLTVTAFGILSVTAVLMLGFRNSGVVVSVLANGVAQMPPAVPSDATLFYVEIGMIAELNTIDGYFTVQAALAPSSHILVSSCRLTGGFALVNWFHPSEHAGDFVFTVGGVGWFKDNKSIWLTYVVSPCLQATAVVPSARSAWRLFYAWRHDQRYRQRIFCHNTKVCHGRRVTSSRTGCWPGLGMA